MTEEFEEWVKRETAVDKVEDIVADWTYVHPLSKVAAEFWVKAFVAAIFNEWAYSSSKDIPVLECDADIGKELLYLVHKFGVTGVK